MKMDLLQPRHNYASKEGLGHLYMPTSLLTVGARLLNAGVDVSFQDENLRPREISADYVGFNLLGAPYIPEVIKLQGEIKRESGDKTFLVGGQVVSGLNPDQLERLFGSSTYNGNDDSTLASILGIDERALASPERTSLIPAYERLDDEIINMYLSEEFSLYVSQGCKKACSFCGADRTFKRKVAERYRDMELIQNDLDYLVDKAQSFGLDELNIYMSNLDVFQTPSQLIRFAYVVQEIQNGNPNFRINLRGLSTVESFIETRNNMPESIEELVKAGFHTVGFGVDGWGREEWKALGKGHNTEEYCLESIRSAREDFGITPEILMVFGNPKTTKEDNIREAFEVTQMVVEKFGAIPRPHVSKDFIPGNLGWVSGKYSEEIEVLLRNPDTFQSLDFTALPSELTHSDPIVRSLATEYFLKMCALPGNTTKPVQPITPDLSLEEIERVRADNEGQFDR